MGAAWCRDRIEQAQNSKSPVDRIITRCSNALSAKTMYAKQNQSKPANDIVFKQIRYASPPVPVHRVPPPRTHSRSCASAKASEWQSIPLQPAREVDVTDGAAPVPPPRKRRKRKVNSLEVLNSQLDMIYEANYHHKRRPKSQLLFGETSVGDENVYLSDSSPERKSVINDSKRKSRARKIMDSKTKNFRKSISEDGNGKPTTPKMVKNVSAISLPSFELAKDDSKEKALPPKRNVSAVSLPGETVKMALSGVTLQRLESYLRRCRSFGSLKPQQLLAKLEEINNKHETESSDSWSGLDDWDLGVIEHCDPSITTLPPKSRINSNIVLKSFEIGPPIERTDEKPPLLSRDTSLSEDILEFPSTMQTWLSTPVLSSTKGMVSLEQLNTPPPTPEEKKVGEVKKTVEDHSYAHSTLLKILRELPSQMSETPMEKHEHEDTEKVIIPTPPHRRSRDNDKRRQSYQEEMAPKPSLLMTRSLSVDTALEETFEEPTNVWRNVSNRQQTLEDFLGFSDNKEKPISGMELFSTIDLRSENKNTFEEVDSPPPPLPSSPPPVNSISQSFSSSFH